MTSGQKCKLLIARVKEGDVDQVKRVFDESEGDDLMVHDCFEALYQALHSYEDEIAHLILDFAEKTFAEKVINIRTNEALGHLLSADRISVPILKRFIDRKVPIDDDHLLRPFEDGNSEVTELLIEAGCSPQSVLRCDFQHFSEWCLKGEHKKVWKLALPHWTADDVTQSNLLTKAIEKRMGGRMLQLFEEQGMNFLPCLSRDDTTSTKIMQKAMDHKDITTVQFLLNHEFDPNSCVHSKPLLHHLLDIYKKYPSAHEVLLHVIRRSHLRNVPEETFWGDNAPVDLIHLRIALLNMHTEIVKELINAGWSPRNMIQRFGLSSLFVNEFAESWMHEEILKVLLPHLTAEDFIQPEFFMELLNVENFLNVLQWLEDLGMDFTPCISSSHPKVVRCMKLALDNGHAFIVRFLVNHKFDVNTCFDSRPFLVCLLGLFPMHEQTTQRCIRDVILNSLKMGANPLLADSDDRNVIDVYLDMYGISTLCDHDYKTSSRTLFCGQVLKLIIRMGYRVPSRKLRYIQADDDLLKETLVENSLVPSLQSLCRLQIRFARGSRTADFMHQLQYPQKLKDFVLFKDIDTM